MKVKVDNIAKVGRGLLGAAILLTCICCGGKKMPEVQPAAKSSSVADAIFEEGLLGEAVIIDNKLSIKIKSERKTWCLVDADPSGWSLLWEVFGADQSLLTRDGTTTAGIPGHTTWLIVDPTTEKKALWGLNGIRLDIPDGLSEAISSLEATHTLRISALVLVKLPEIGADGAISLSLSQADIPITMREGVQKK
jgi:hypothetical protein